MKVHEIRPIVEHGTVFDLYSLSRIRDCTGCYCLTNAGRDILYIGQAFSVQQRLLQHFDSDKREALTPQGRVSQVWWRETSTAELNALERGWQEMYRLLNGKLPPLNAISAPI